jgi:hypothetical protein
MGDQVSNQSLPDLVTGRKRVSQWDPRSLGRAALNGLTLGWADEGEAWLRSKLEGDLSQGYDAQLAEIRREQGQYAKDNPWTSGVAEFAGGVLPSVFVPGGAAKGAAGLARLAGMGTATGAVAGAGNAVEGERWGGAATGGALGGALGVALPLAIRGAGAGVNAIRERVGGSDSYVTQVAADKMRAALERAGVSPQTIAATMANDKGLGVPSVLLNAARPLEKQARGVVKRGGAGAQEIEDALGQQRMGTRERSYAQVEKNLDPGQYFDDLERIQKEMRTRAGPAYQQAYSYGEVTDPNVLKYLQLPQFQQGMGEAQKLLAAEGRQLDMSKPTVEVLDQVKRGIDALIEKQTDPVTGKTTSLGRVYVKTKNDFLKELDAAVPDYELARGIYAGGAEIADALRKGMKDFTRMKPEEVNKLVAGMSQSEKEAFRTGVARNLYSQVMEPSGNFNAAQRLVGAPSMQQKLAPLFDTPAQADLYKAALEREAQLFHTSNRILGGSDTAENTRLIADIEGNPMVNQFVKQGVKSGFPGAITDLTFNLLNTGTMSDKVAGKLSKMLLAKDPHEVAAAVKLLEESAAAVKPRAAAATGREAGAVTGTASAIFPSPEAPAERRAMPTGEAPVEAPQRRSLMQILDDQEKQGLGTR